MTTTSRPASLLPAATGQSYVDPADRGREQELIFERMWFCVQAM